MNEEKDDKFLKLELILGSIFSRMQALDEKVECILHTICKNNDEKTHQAIGKFIRSDFRNREK